jgi:glycosyltransferase involved in cell wall biosynthesis
VTTKYVIITPVRDEEQYIEFTIQSVLSQTIRPAKWMIVDDGSADRTAAVAESYAARYPWIRVIRRANRGFRQSGAGVMEAFHDGFDQLGYTGWDFLAKLDGDLSFSPNYFALLFDRFRAQTRLGIAGGNIFHSVEGKLKLEKCPRFHVRGATKVYRRECWEQIEGLVTAPGWDIVDETRASMLGWTTTSFDDLQLIHHRVTGTAESKWRDQIKNGRAYYVAGYHPLFMAAKCIYRLTSKPYVLGSTAMAAGFISGYISGLPRASDQLIRFVRRQQLLRLCGGSTIWK